MVTAEPQQPTDPVRQRPASASTPGKGRRLSNRKVARPEWRRTEAIYTKNRDLLLPQQGVTRGGAGKQRNVKEAVEAVAATHRPLQAQSPSGINARESLRRAHCAGRPRE